MPSPPLDPSMATMEDIVFSGDPPKLAPNDVINGVWLLCATVHLQTDLVLKNHKRFQRTGIHIPVHLTAEIAPHEILLKPREAARSDKGLRADKGRNLLPSPHNPWRAFWTRAQPSAHSRA